MKKTKKIIAWLLAIIVILFLGMLIYLKQASYQPSQAADQTAKSAQITKQVTTFKGKKKKQKQTEIIFYPGALVAPNSYSIWAKDLADHGYTVKIAHFPLNLAIFKQNMAEQITNKENYVIGGHSLGGAMAARYVHNHHPKNLKGIFFLAAYADEKGRLDHLNIPALSIVASRDGVLNWQKYQENKKYLPKNSSFDMIHGGNHGGFGSYGQQKGDRQATISNAKQQKLIAQYLLKWLKKMNKQNH